MITKKRFNVVLFLVVILLASVIYLSSYSSSIYTKTKLIFIVYNPPVIVLNSPLGDIMSQNWTYLNYSVFDSDNDKMNCTIYVDYENDTIYNFQIVNTSYNLNNNSNVIYNFSSWGDGYYEWYVNCSDEHGTTSLSNLANFSIDTSPPFLVVLEPDYHDILGHYIWFIANASDSNAIDSVWYELYYNSSYPSGLINTSFMEFNTSYNWW